MCQPSPGLQVLLRKLPTWCPSLGTRLVGSLQCPCVFSAGVPAGRGGGRWLVFLQGGAGAPRCPCARSAGSAPQDPARTETGREVVTPGAVSHPGAAATRPTPSLCRRCLSSPLLPALSLSLFFSPGVGTPGGRRPGESQLTRSLPSKSCVPPGGNWVAAPSRLRWLSPPTLQPGLNGGTELDFSALGGEWWWLKGRWYFPRKSAPGAPPSSSATLWSTQLAWLPRPLLGKT